MPRSTTPSRRRENTRARLLAAVREATNAVPAGELSWDSIALVLESLRPFGRQWYPIRTELVLLALRNEEARATPAKHDRRFRAELVKVIGDVLARLERTPNDPGGAGQRDRGRALPARHRPGTPG
jgi:hypothetical protein